MFNKILIANRGEIACRIIRTAKRLGIKTVAVYSEIEENALHVLLADEAYCIGKAFSQDSYLCGDKIIAVALQSNAQAIHPGYGFLSENAKFATAVQAAGLIFIGPTPAVISTMGSKTQAKQKAEEIGIPTTPGYHGEDQDPNRLFEQAKKIAFPLLIKAAAGGGGKGMRLVKTEEEFIPALQAAQREAFSSFNDSTIFLEKYITEPRHIEVQIFGDNFGNIIHLYERDCSIQRRHQKVFEEAPAPQLSEQLRKNITTAAVTFAKAIGYTNAGTIEFLVSQEQQFYFMEMNTRLQVEHPVTEMITGLDLVEWQLKVAAGEPLPLQQSQISCHGHAIEARLYAEDPNRDFLPVTGNISVFVKPEENTFLRLESAIRNNEIISPYYDPMIAKIIAFGKTREMALELLKVALNESHIIGIKTNLDFLRAIINSHEFKSGSFSTHFIDQNLSSLLTISPLPSAVLLMATCYELYKQKNYQLNSMKTSQDPYSPWNKQTNWRLNQTSAQRFHFKYFDQQFITEVIEFSNEWQIKANEEIFNVTQILYDHHQLEIKLPSSILQMKIINDKSQLHILSHQPYVLTCREDHEQEEITTGEINSIQAPMPGKIIAMNVKVGDTFVRGTTLIVLEAMKMEHSIAAPIDGKITACHYKVGDMIEEGKEILLIDPQT